MRTRAAAIIFLFSNPRRGAECWPIYGWLFGGDRVSYHPGTTNSKDTAFHEGQRSVLLYIRAMSCSTDNDIARMAHIITTENINQQTGGSHGRTTANGRIVPN